MSALKEVRKELDQADAEVDAAKDKEDAAEEKLDDKQEIAATDGDETPEQRNANDEEVGKAKDEVTEARLESQRKDDQRAETRTKSAAKVEQLVAAGSIASKPTATVAQVLKEMQTEFLEEDFADELVAACIVELGLAPSDVVAQEVFSKIRTNFAAKLLRATDDEAAEGLRKSIATFKESFRTLDRTSRLTEDCFTHLGPFVERARDQDVELEKLRIGTQTVDAARQRAVAQSEALQAFEKSVSTCNKATDDKVKTACIVAASRITESGSGLVEVGQAQQVSIVVPDATLPLVAFEAAAAERKPYGEIIKKLPGSPVPTVTKEELKKEKADLDKVRIALDKSVKDLSADLNKRLDKQGQTAKKTAIRQFQDGRTQLVTNLAVAPASQPLLVEQARLALQQHDNEAKQVKELYTSLSKRMSGVAKAVKVHLEKIEALKKKEAGTG